MNLDPKISKLMIFFHIEWNILFIFFYCEDIYLFDKLWYLVKLSSESFIRNFFYYYWTFKFWIEMIRTGWKWLSKIFVLGNSFLQKLSTYTFFIYWIHVMIVIWKFLHIEGSYFPNHIFDLIWYIAQEVSLNSNKQITFYINIVYENFSEL